MPDERIVEIPEGYIVSGFFTSEDATKEAHGAIAAFRVDGEDYIHLYSSKEDVTKGYGYSVSDKYGVNAIPVEKLNIVTDATNAVRVFITKNGSVTIKKGETEIYNKPVTDDCNCNLPDYSNTIYFAFDQNTSAYVDFAVEHSIPINHKIEDVSDVVTSLKTAVENQKQTTTKDKTVFGDIIADKLQTYEVANNRKFIVAPVKVNAISLSQVSWNSLAQKVFDESNLGTGDILITLPYVQCPGIGVDLGEYFFMPGIAKGTDVKIDLTKLSSTYINNQRYASLMVNSQTLPIWDFVKDVFINTEKYYYQRYHYINARGEIIGGEKIVENYSGYLGTYDYRLVCDSRFEDYAGVLSSIDNLKPEAGQIFTEQMGQALLRYQNQYDNFFTLFPAASDFIVDHGMKEAGGTDSPDYCLTFTKWYRDRIYSLENETASPPDNCFYLGRNQVVYDETLQQIDMIGLVLAPFNADWIADGFGFVYASYYCDFTNSAIYASGLAIPVVSAVVLKGSTKALIKGLMTGNSEVVQQGGEYVIRAITKVDNTIDALITTNKSIFGRNTISLFADAYPDHINSIVSRYGLTLDEFKILIQKPKEGIVINTAKYGQIEYLTPTELSKIENIRLELISTFDDNTIFEKAITKTDATDYMNNAYRFGNSAGGYVSRAQDVKHLTTPEATYWGLRLDLDLTPPLYDSPSDAEYIVRFTTKEHNKLNLPPLEPYPNTGNGFTAGTNGFLGIPELKAAGGMEFESASIIRKKADGTEVLESVFDSDLEQFRKVNQ